MRTNILLTVALIAAMTLAGCAKEENNMEQFTIDMEQISILAGEDYKVTPSGAFTARSTDEDVATVNTEGIIHGVSAGEANIIFTSSDGEQSRTCKASVDWRYKYFEEPVIAFGATKEEIKSMETHTPVAETDEHIRYENTGTEIEMSVGYSFGDDGGLNVIRVVVFSQIRYRDYPDKITMQLAERYGEPFVTDKSNQETIFEPRGKDFTVHFYPFILLIEYLPKNKA